MIEVASRYTAGRAGRAGQPPPAVAHRAARRQGRVPVLPPGRRCTGGESAAAADPHLDEYLHLYMINRGILMTPFHNMALMCPATTEADADAHTAVFAAAADELLI